MIHHKHTINNKTPAPRMSNIDSKANTKQVQEDDLPDYFDRYYEELQSYRRHFHAIAEEGWLEFETTLALVEKLSEWGYTLHLGKDIHAEERLNPPSQAELADYYKKFINLEAFHKKAGLLGLSKEKQEEILQGYTGLVADFDTGRKGPLFAFRFDIDALPFAESATPDHRPFAEDFAEKTGRACHACGHDGHISIGLHLAKRISQTGGLNGSYRFIFQPAEESCRGAKSMVEKGLSENVDYFFSLHLGLGMPPGLIGVGTDYFLDKRAYSLDILGQEAHAASCPEKGRNALLGAAALVLDLHTLTQNSKGETLLNVGEFKSGVAPNIIPGKASLVFELRANNKKDLDHLEQKALLKIKKHCAERGLEAVCKYCSGAESIREDYKEKYKCFSRKIAEFLQKKGYRTMISPRFGASEDVVCWMNEVLRQKGTALHFMIGANLTADHHQPHFDFDEEALLTGAKCLWDCLLYLQEKDGPSGF